MSQFLTSHSITNFSCRDIRQAVCEIQSGAGVLLIADEACADESIPLLYEALDQQPSWSDLPILLLTRAGSTPSAGDQNLTRLGNVTVIERPVGGGPLLTAIQSALRARLRQYEARQHLITLERNGEELRVAGSRKDELLGLVSHELRTPLTLILGAADILAKREQQLGPQVRRELVQEVVDNGARLRRIIENMLVLSKAESLAEVTLEPILLQRELPAWIASLAPLTGCTELQLNVPEDLPPVVANSAFLEQIIANLVRNSEKYASAGEPIELSGRVAEEAVEIQVRDRGRPYTEQEVMRMFESFYRDPATATRVSGLGLGLAVCRRLAEVQGSRIEARPRPGGGVTMLISLPIAHEDV
jgi:signal transduction histidine kinase